MSKKRLNKEDTLPKEKLSEALWQDVQCNFTSLLYLMTEQQAIIGKLLEELVRVGVLNGVSLERLTSIKSDIQDFDLVYKDIHKRFSNYFYAVRKVMSETTPDENGDFNGRK